MARATAMLGDKLVKLASGAVLTILVARWLGASDLGIYSIVMAWSAFLVPVSSLGLNNIVVRQMAKFDNKSDAITMLYSAVSMRLVLGIASAVIALCLFYFMYPEFNQGHISIAVFILFFCQAFIGFLLFEFYLNYLGVFRRVAYAKSVITFLSFATKLFLLYQGVGIAALLLMTGIEFFLVAMAQWMFYGFAKVRRQVAAEISESGSAILLFKTVMAKILLKRSSWLWLSGIVSVIYLKIDIVMIGAMTGTEQAGVYAAASRLSELWYVFPATLAARYYPDMIAAFNAGEGRYYSRLKHYARLFFISALSIAVVMTLCAPWIIAMLFGDDFANAVQVLQIHVWAGCFIFVRYLISQHLLITEQEPLSLMSHGVGALLNVLLNLWLIPAFGIVGAAWATLISYAYASFFFLFFAHNTRRQLWLVLKAGAHKTIH